MSDVYYTMMGVALHRAGRHGKGNSSRKNKRIEVSGPYKPLWTFVGLIHRVEGVVTCFYYNQPIFAVDFINARITNFDMTSYSLSTGENIRRWEYACYRMFTFPPYVYVYHSWVHTPSHYEPHQPGSADAYARFSRLVPWVHDDLRGVRWFAWEHYDSALAETYHQSNEFLRSDQNWRYFDYDWDDFGKWTRHFKNADAERRWKMRERKRERAARKKAA
jgi:hypothetical protein